VLFYKNKDTKRLLEWKELKMEIVKTYKPQLAHKTKLYKSAKLDSISTSSSPKLLKILSDCVKKITFV
jgi:hypothetical protein